MNKKLLKSFNSRLDKLLAYIPLLGKIINSFFGLIEVPLLEFLRILEQITKREMLVKFTQYFLRSRWGGNIIPLNVNLSPETSFLPTQEIMKIIERSNVTGVSWCYCRATQRKIDPKNNCEHPLHTCIHIGKGNTLQEIPSKSYNLKKVPKSEVIELIREADRRGLIHQLIFFPNPNFYYVICNCCPCCCVVLKNFLKYGSPQMIRSDFSTYTNRSVCTNCGGCQDWCYFGARKVIGEKLVIDLENCFGCGICVSKCSKNAISLKRKTESIEKAIF